MFQEEAAWIRQALADLELPEGGEVLDVGSSTLEARTVVQPYIDSEVHAPLRNRGLKVTHVDQKEDPGVDVALDLADPAVDLAGTLGRRFGLVLCMNMLSFVSDLGPVLRSVTGAVDEGGYLLLTTVENFRWTTDPVDNFWRPSPEEMLERAVSEGGVALEPVARALIRIDDPEEYTGAGRKTTVRLTEKLYLPVPRSVDRLRLRSPRHRWRQSCVLARRAG